MANVLNNEKKQQILALGQLGCSLRRIQAATHVRRETISTYLKAAGVGVWPPGGWGRQTVSKPAIGVTTDFGAELSALRPENQDLVAGDSAKPAIEVTTGYGVELRGPGSEKPSRNPSASACEPFQEAIELGLSRGRNAMAIWQDLVSDYGFTRSYQSVKRYIHKRRGSPLPQATAVILTAPGEEALSCLKARFDEEIRRWGCRSRGSIVMFNREIVVVSPSLQKHEHPKPPPSIAHTSERSSTTIRASLCEVTASRNLKAAWVPHDSAFALNDRQVANVLDVCA